MSDQSLKTRISDAMKAAMRAHEKARLATIRLMLADMKRIEVDERIELDDERIITILDKMVKQRRESIKQYEAAQRQDLADQEQSEIDVIQEFMPAALNEDELIQIIDRAITESSAVSMKDMGSVMAFVRPQVSGRADMGQVSALVKSRLS
jgi:uncharacterized protein YqeY